MKRTFFALAIITLLFGSQAFAWMTPISTSYKALADTFAAWHNYDLFFKATPTAGLADGSRMFNFTTTVSVDPTTSGAEWSGLYSTATYTAGTNGTFTLNGIEGVARPNASAIGATFRGVYGRTYVSGVNYKVATMSGAEFSPRSVADWNPKLGTSIFGTRVWMAIYGSGTKNRDSIAINGNFDGVNVTLEPASGLGAKNYFRAYTYGSTADFGLNLDDAVIDSADIKGQAGHYIKDLTAGWNIQNKVYITATGDSGAAGLKSQRDTLSAKVGAFSTMSEWVLPVVPNVTQSLVGWVVDVNTYAGMYAVGGSDVCRFTFPHRYINGAKVIMDSLIYWRQLLTATDTLMVTMGSTDTVGNRTVTVGYDTTLGTGSKALLRKARAWRAADTSAYNRTEHIEFTTKALTDTCFLRQIHFKFHTIP